MVLYKHGVGFIERAKKFKGKDPLKLSFKKNNMDDILKSLCIFDMGEGKVTGVSYETAEDVSRLLADKAITVPDREALVGLMRQLKGYKVRIDAPDGELEGTVVGTEEKKKVTDAGNLTTDEDFVVMKDADGKMKAVDIEKIAHFQIIDNEAKEDLDFYLEAVTSERKKNVKSLTIFLDGEDHDVSVSYIMSMPSWRVSYRLAFGEKETVLQGWGIIDNRLDEDLKDIGLSLVAGKPISFIYDIYTPRIVPRPIVREEVRTVSAPVELEGGLEALDDMEMLAAEAKCADYDSGGEMYEASLSKAVAAPKSEMRRMASRAAYGGAPAPPPASKPDFSRSAEVQTKTVEMGEFFKYDIETAVTVKRGQSAMVPILQCPITCAKEHVYNPQKMPRNPVITMRVKNNTGAVLERGPILVLDEGTYVGEAILPYTTVESENHIAYAVDLGVTVKEEYKSGSELKVISIANRYFQKEYLEWKECEYEVQNKKKDGIELVIEHPKSDYKIDEKVTQKATEETESYYRWKFNMKPKSSSKFKVREVITRYYSETIRNLSLTTIKSYLDNNYISKRDYGDVKDIIDLQQEINRLNNENSRLENERNQIYNEQSRLRSNLESLGNSTREEKLRVTYVDKLDAQEKRLEAIERELKDNRGRIEKLDKGIENKLKSLK
jgi:hypothetical protein